MLELETTGTKIPQGYLVQITSWENDADNYITLSQTGLSLREVEFLKGLLPQFDSQEDISNEDLDVKSLVRILRVLEEKYPEETLRFFPTLGKISRVEDFVPHQDTLYDSLCDLLGYPVQYDHGHVRVFDSMDVYLIEEDTSLPPALETL